MSLMTISLQPYQLTIAESSAKRVVICAGRRGGKTYLAVAKAIQMAMQGRRVLYAVPIAKQATVFWEWATDVLSGVQNVTRHELTRTLDFIESGGRIECKTAHDPDSLRSDYADFLILDEYAYMDPDAWESVGAPMLMDNDGTAWFISTPEFLNHFYHLWMKAQQEQIEGNPRWATFHFSSRENRYLSADALAELTKDMTPDNIEREIEAKFIKGEGSVFTNIDACLWTPDPDEIAKHKSHPTVMTIDWGQVQDFTSISIGCKKCSRELKLIRWKGVDYPEQQRRIKELRDHWKPESIYAEANSIGLPNIQALQAAGVEVMRFDTTAESKRQIIQGLRLALERGEWKFVDDPVAKLELEAYESKVSGQTGQVSYSAPSGMHDDTVISRAILVWASASSGFGGHY